MKKAILILVAVAVAAGALYLWKTKKGEPDLEAPKVKAVEVRRGPIVHSVETSGFVASNLDVEIKCRASGEIVSLPYEESDTVEKGKLVLELDPQDEARNVGTAEVTLASARARLEKSRQSLKIAEQELENSRGRADVTLEAAEARADDANAKDERVKELLDRKLAGREEYDSARSAAAQAAADLEKARIAVRELKTQEAALELKRQDVLLAKADVKSAEISLGIARRRLEYTKVFAPIGGVITKRFVQEGQIISSATSNVGGGTSIMTISDISRLYVISSVDESDIGSVRRGQEVEITADAFPGQPFQGVVDRIAPKGQNVSNVVTFEVRIEVLGAGGTSGRGTRPEGDFDREAFKRRMENMSEEDREKMKRHMGDFQKKRRKPDNPSGAGLKPEMTANVKIIIERKDDVLMVPVEAVSRAQGKQTVSVVADEGKSEEREVKTGIGDGVNIEIAGGLKEGEKVLVKEGAVESMWGRDDRRRMPPMGGPMMRRR